MLALDQSADLQIQEQINSAVLWTSARSSLVIFSWFFFIFFCNVQFARARYVLFLSCLKQRLVGEGRSGENICRLRKADKACLEEKVLQGLSFLFHICLGGGKSGAAPNFRVGLLTKQKGSGMRDADSKGGQLLNQVLVLLIWENPARQTHCKL